ncbi:MAG: VOC family protein [Myxococcota bacterium]
MSDVRFDHIAVALRKVSDVPPFLVGGLGAEPAAGGPGPGYRGGQWTFPGDARLETLEPAGEPGGFLHRFLERHGAGIHHVTFKVPSLREGCRRAEAAGYEIVGYDDHSPSWKEAFLHPKQALGIVVQLAESDDEAEDAWRPGWIELPPTPEPPAPARLVGLRMTAPDAARARRQWGEVLRGEIEELDGELISRWPGSPMRIGITIDPSLPARPVALELEADRPLGLSGDPDPVLGARFVQL